MATRIPTYFLALACVLLTAAAPADTPARHVLVVINEDSSDSRTIGEYYSAKRKIPGEQICRVHCDTGETTTVEKYERDVAAPLRRFLKRNEIAGRIDYIVLTMGIPIKVTGTQPDAQAMRGPRSLDSILACLDFEKPPTQTPWRDNPYYRKSGPFTHKEYGIFLVTRLTGYTVADAKRLIDDALKAKPAKGQFLFDLDPTKNWKGTLIWYNQQKAAAQALEERGYTVRLENTKEFVKATGLMGYASWGSNDKGFDSHNYENLVFIPGSIAETYVSTSARSFVKLHSGQSQIGDLIAGGCTGVKGYVSEPYTLALADVSILFDRYTRGCNLAESFYAASPFTYWKDLVIGDPICSPYAKG